MKNSENNFRLQVYDLVGRIPPGRVMTYGQIAALCGSPRSARIVGGVAHYGNPDLPWHRVVSKNGGLASGFPGGKASHKVQLEAEGVFVTEDYRVEIEKLLWRPKQSGT
jgi:methylated-DNA-protein-cysteine methyltransferase related protein